MLTRRSSLKQIMALGLAPAIMRVAPLMPIKPISREPAYDRNFGVEVMPGVFVHPCWEPWVDEYKSLTVVRNTTALPVRFHYGQILKPRSLLVMSKALRPPTRVWHTA